MKGRSHAKIQAVLSKMKKRPKIRHKMATIGYALTGPSIYAASSRSKEIYSIVNKSARREGDLIRECVLHHVGDIQRCLERGNHDTDGLDYIVFRIDWIISILVRYLGTTGVDPQSNRPST